MRPAARTALPSWASNRITDFKTVCGPSFFMLFQIGQCAECGVLRFFGMKQTAGAYHRREG